jgi:hypothetical protein
LLQKAAAATLLTLNAQRDMTLNNVSAASTSNARMSRFTAKMSSRLPYFFLAPASLSALFFLIKAGEAGSPESSFAHNVGLFFFPGASSFDVGICSSLLLRVSYFLLHLQMSLLISIICKANRFTAFGMPAIVRRVVFFSLGYAAVGIAAPVMLAFTGDAGILDHSNVDNEVHSDSPTIFDDSDFDTYTTLFINVGWLLISHMFFGTTTCTDEYKLPATTTLFDYSIMIWASCLLLPLLMYNSRALLPVFWRRLGLRKTGGGYLGLAVLNFLSVCAFAAKELLSYNALEVHSPFRQLSHSQQSQVSNNRIAALLDYVFMTLTMAVFVFRLVGWSGAVGVLVCPPVALPLCLSKMSASERKHK